MKKQEEQAAAKKKVQIKKNKANAFETTSITSSTVAEGTETSSAIQSVSSYGLSPPGFDRNIAYEALKPPVSAVLSEKSSLNPEKDGFSYNIAYEKPRLESLLKPTDANNPMEEENIEPLSSPLSKSYNLNPETLDDSIPILSQSEDEITNLLDSTVEKTPTDPNPHVAPHSPSPFKTPIRPVEKPVEMKKRMNRGTLFHQSSSSSRESQTSLSLPEGTDEPILELLRSVSQNQEESPAPALNYRTPSELLLDQDLSHAEGLMKDVQFCINGKINDKVRKLLGHAKATSTNYPAETNTHILMGSNPDMGMVYSAKALNEHVYQVDEDWVMFSCLVGQLLPICEDKFLAGIVACVGEMNDEDRNKIWAMLTWRGAKVVTSLSSEVTHIIANTTLDKLCLEASSNPNIKIVSSDWVVTSLKKNSRIDEEEYHPQLLQEDEPPPPAARSEKSLEIIQGLLKLQENQNCSRSRRDQVQEDPSIQSSSGSAVQGKNQSVDTVVPSFETMNIDENLGKFRIYSILVKLIQF